MHLKEFFKRLTSVKRKPPSDLELGDFVQRLTDTPIYHGDRVVVFVNIGGKTWQQYYIADDWFGAVHLEKAKI